MTCPKCGAQLLPDAKFCGACGFRMDAQSQSAAQPSAAASPTFAEQVLTPGGNQTSAGAFRVDADGRGEGRGYTWEVQHGA